MKKKYQHTHIRAYTHRGRTSRFFNVNHHWKDKDPDLKKENTQHKIQSEKNIEQKKMRLNLLNWITWSARETIRNNDNEKKKKVPKGTVWM
jgi:hypothetical protein